MRRMAALAAGCTLVFTAVAAASVNGSYTGKESQNGTNHHPYPISLTVSGSNITRIIYGATYSGRNGCAGYSGAHQRATFGGPEIRIRNSAFKATVTVAPKDVIKVQGTISGKKMSGSLQEKFTPSGKSFACSVGFTFTAKR